MKLQSRIKNIFYFKDKKFSSNKFDQIIRILR